MRGSRVATTIVTLIEAEKELHRLLKVKGDFWHQRPKLFWLKSGDPNIWSFHSMANKRRKKNGIL